MSEELRIARTTPRFTAHLRSDGRWLPYVQITGYLSRTLDADGEGYATAEYAVQVARDAYGHNLSIEDTGWFNCTALGKQARVREVEPGVWDVKLR